MARTSSGCGKAWTGCEAFGLTLGDELVIADHPLRFAPAQRTTAVAVYFGGPGGGAESVRGILDPTSVTVIPVASTETQVPNEIPPELRFLNCVLKDRDGSDRLLSTVLECLGLLRRQRRILELPARRSGRRRDPDARSVVVFLDTHGVLRAVDFQETLWHKLCDVDVMVMLESPTYFRSRWTC